MTTDPGVSEAGPEVISLWMEVPPPPSWLLAVPLQEQPTPLLSVLSVTTAFRIVFSGGGTGASVCSLLQQYLHVVGADRLVLGHSPDRPGFIGQPNVSRLVLHEQISAHAAKQGQRG